MSDFNRLRWVYYGLQANAKLRLVLQNTGSETVWVYDTPYLINHQVTPGTNSYLVLWDGFNSYLELLRARTDLVDRSDLTYVYVGSFAEIAAALPQRSLKLFPAGGSFKGQKLDVPFRFKAALKLKTSLRGLKNHISAGARHRKLSVGGNLVFCGLVRPTKQVIANILTNHKLLALQSAFEQLGAAHWQNDPKAILPLVMTLYRACEQMDSVDAEDYSGIYAVLNVCCRLYIVNALHAHGCKVFINEYGFQQNFDPYDVHAYRDNTYLDFGSTRGACHWYPRTMDMHATGKNFVALRVIQETDSLRHHLESNSDRGFIDQLNTHVATALQVAANAKVTT